MAAMLVNRTGEQLIRNHLQHIPRPDQQACSAIREWARQQGQDLDPDQTDVVTLHYRGNEAVVTQRLSLTQAVLSNWQGETNKDLIGQLLPGHWAGTLPDGPLTIVERLPELGVFESGAGFSVFNGLFRTSNPARYDSTTHLPIDVEAMQQFIWNLDFHKHFTNMLDNYWDKAKETHRQSLQISFIAACNKQVEEGSLSDAGRQLAWQAAGIMQSVPGLEIRALNVYGYASTDLIYIAAPAHPQVLLYVPGNSSPFHEFDDMAGLKAWFGNQCSDADKRQSLRQHFKLADTPDGLDFSGLDTALDGLGTYPAFHHRSPNRSGFTVDGPWPPAEYVNYRPHKFSPLLEGELFAALTLRQRKRSYADADFITTSDAQVIKARWRGYLVASINLLAPLAIVVPELIPLLALGGVAQFGLGLDQAISGKTPEEKEDGVSNITFGLLNAVPMAGRAATSVRKLFAGESVEYIMPRRVNNKLGYPLSPIGSPRLPAEEVMDVAEELRSSFSRNTPIPLPEGSHLARWVTRFIDPTGAERMQAIIGETEFPVLYDSKHDAFIRDSDKLSSQPTYYRLINPEAGLEEVNAPPLATNEMRVNTLQAMGINLELPIVIPPAETLDWQDLPKNIFCIWVGGDPIPDSVLKTLEANAESLQGGTDFTYKIFLSNSDETALALHRRQLGELTSRPQIKILEDIESFYPTFEEEYNDQFTKALDNKHYSSAANILRYPLLNEEGGLYIDADDLLTTVREFPNRRASILETDLKVPEDGLLLGSTVQFEPMDLVCDFNNTPLGSYPGSSALSKISEVMRERYLANESFYDTRLLKDDPGFKAFTVARSKMSGPLLLNDIIDTADSVQDPELFRLRVMRLVAKLRKLPQINRDSLLPESLRIEIEGIEGRELALRSYVKVGSLGSWN